jgi:hypothetical protein
MADTYQLLKVFLSSPGDVEDERKIAEEVISKVNKSCRDTLGIQADTHTWKSLPPITPNMSENTIQDIINEEVRACNVFVLILYKRYGTIKPGFTKSNTEREIDIALKMLSEGRNIMFLSYFRELAPNSDPGEQEEKVRALRDYLSNLGLWYRTYESPEDFKDDLAHDLYQTILKFQVATSKSKILRSFWQLGTPSGITHPQLSIIYPPVDRYYMRQENPDAVWLKRLVPHVVFEDFKALQKFEKTLRIIGYRDFEFFSISGAPPDIQDRNRLWICLPRNESAQSQLLLYKDRALFNLTEREINVESKIKWRKNIRQKKYISIHSPLSKYLLEQRAEIPGGDWQTQHGRIYAKDFAVLSRFSDNRERLPMSSGTLKDYFFAGIRGLGTWGAAWFIDRRYNNLKKYCINDYCDIQILLEVTYKNEQILDVRDVSMESESYFRNENDIRTIRKMIKKNR